MCFILVCCAFNFLFLCLANHYVVTWLSQGLCVTWETCTYYPSLPLCQHQLAFLASVLPGEGLSSGQTGIQKEHIKSPVNSENTEKCKKKI